MAGGTAFTNTPPRNEPFLLESGGSRSKRSDLLHYIQPNAGSWGALVLTTLGDQKSGEGGGFQGRQGGGNQRVRPLPLARPRNETGGEGREKATHRKG